MRPDRIDRTRAQERLALSDHVTVGVESHEAVARADPHGAIRRGAERKAEHAGPERQRRDGLHLSFAESIEPVRAGDPDVAFAVLEDAENRVRRQPLELADMLDDATVAADGDSIETRAERADPGMAGFVDMHGTGEDPLRKVERRAAVGSIDDFEDLWRNSQNAAVAILAQCEDRSSARARSLEAAALLIPSGCSAFTANPYPLLRVLPYAMDSAAERVVVEPLPVAVRQSRQAEWLVKHPQ